VVLNGRRPRLEPALVVPDEMSWTMWGTDLRELGVVPAGSATAARSILAPAHVPQALAQALNDARRLAGDDVAVRSPGPSPLLGVRLEDVAEVGTIDALRTEDGRGHHGPEMDGHDQGHGAHGGQDHHDMMAIVGEPSRDGLVMEAIDLEVGPLSGGLAGGLVLALSLDGDVVEDAEVRATLVAGRDAAPLMPDPLTPVTWRVAADVAAEVASGTVARARTQWERLAALEAERALSHLAWLRSFARLLGWAELAAAAQRALAPLVHDTAGAPGDDRLQAATRALAPVLHLAGRARFRRRLAGRGVLRDDPSGLSGPNARAAALARDGRSADPLYAELAFAPVVRSGGDALARASVRIEETRAALDLAVGAAGRARATDAAASGTPGALGSAARAAIEGPRGRILASRAAPDAPLEAVAEGAPAARVAAAAAARGSELSAALVTVASFDLSPWTLGA